MGNVWLWEGRGWQESRGEIQRARMKADEREQMFLIELTPKLDFDSQVSWARSFIASLNRGCLCFHGFWSCPLCSVRPIRSVQILHLSMLTDVFMKCFCHWSHGGCAEKQSDVFVYPSVFSMTGQQFTWNCIKKGIIVPSFNKSYLVVHFSSISHLLSNTCTAGRCFWCT